MLPPPRMAEVPATRNGRAFKRRGGMGCDLRKDRGDRGYASPARGHADLIASSDTVSVLAAAKCDAQQMIPIRMNNSAIFKANSHRVLNGNFLENVGFRHPALTTACITGHSVTKWLTLHGRVRFGSNACSGKGVRYD